MSKETIQSTEQWHKRRRTCIGASEVAALFGCHTYMTANKLYHLKRGNLIDVPTGDEPAYIEFGNVMEPIIAQLAAGKSGWQLEDRKEHQIAEDCPAIGCTVDRFVVESERGPGILEIKNVCAFAPGWTETRAPEHIEWQVQHQLAVTGLPWAAICSLHGGNPDDLRIMFREPDKKAIKLIKERSTKFMEDVARGVEPEIVDPKDFDHIRDMFLYAEEFDKLEQETRPMGIDFDNLICEYKDAQERRKQAESDEKVAKAKIFRGLMVEEDGTFKKDLLATTDNFFVGIKPIHMKETTSTRKAHTQLRLSVKDAPDNMNMGA